MSFDRRDTQALNDATNAGISCFGMDSVGDGRNEVYVKKIECPYQPQKPNGDSLLAKAIEAYARIYPKDTVWVEICSDSIPQYIHKAIKSLSGLGCRVVITHGKSSTHGSGQLLANDLIKDTKAANQAGDLWHPIENKFVRAD